MAELLQPKEIEIVAQDGTKRVYLLSKFPAIPGREIVCKYPLSGLPKLGDYAVNEETMLKLMGFVAVPGKGADGASLRLETRALVDNHIPDWETLAKIEVAMLEYNCSFFGNGLASTFFENLGQKAQALITKILTDYSERSSPKGAQP
jgi:hypothetical protein